MGMEVKQQHPLNVYDEDGTLWVNTALIFQ
jgi:hypothetical protein